MGKTESKGEKEMTLIEAAESYGFSGKNYSFDILPVPKPRMTRSDKWKKRPAVLRYFEYRDLFRYVLAKSELQKLPECLSVVFALPMPESWSKSRKSEHLFKPHRQTPDIDNLIKALQDTQEQDCYIYRVTALKIWSEQPRIIIYENT